MTWPALLEAEKGRRARSRRPRLPNLLENLDPGGAGEGEEPAFGTFPQGHRRYRQGMMRDPGRLRAVIELDLIEPIGIAGIEPPVQERYGLAGDRIDAARHRLV